VIIHAVGDLIVPAIKKAYQFWKISPLELIIFIASVSVTIFSTPANGIYTSVGASMVILLWRIAHPRGKFLGRVPIQAVEQDQSPSLRKCRHVYVPLSDKYVNPDVHVEDAAPGVIIYRFEESLTFLNASLINDRIVEYAKLKTRRGHAAQYKTLGERPWNEGFVPRNMDKVLKMNDMDTRPILRAVVYDFSGVSNIDTTGVQSLVDTSHQLDRYADRQVEYHFASIMSPWIKRALVAGGFGAGTPAHHIVEVVSAVSTMDVETSNAGEKFQHSRRTSDVEAMDGIEQCSSVHRKILPIIPTNYPFFHLDLDHAVRSAERAA